MLRNIFTTLFVGWINYLPSAVKAFQLKFLFGNTFTIAAFTGSHEGNNTFPFAAALEEFFSTQHLSLLGNN